MKNTFIVDGMRSPVGNFLGGLKNIPAPQILSHVIKKLVEKNKISESLIQELVVGHVLSAGVGQAPAKQAARMAGLKEETSCYTVNKVCGSGMQAVINAAHSLSSQDKHTYVLAAGMENMSRVPHLLPIREGQKFGALSSADSMQMDGLWDVPTNQSMGQCAELCADKYELSRKMQDDFAIASYQRAQSAIKDGIFKREIVEIPVFNKGQESLFDTDEGPKGCDFDKIPKLKAVFKKDGTITAANASTINDGAACLLLTNDKSKAKFEILATAAHGEASEWFTIAPIQSMNKCLKSAGLNYADIDYFEINEAFSVVPLVAMKECKISHEKINVFGGGISLGHPIGCSGTRIIVTLMNVLERKNAEIGMGSICIGGGEALSIIIRRIK